MFIRPIPHLRTLKLFQTWTQIFSTRSAIYRSYAIFEKNGGRCTALTIDPKFSCSDSVRYASEQLKVKEQADGSPKLGYEQVIVKLESFYNLNGFICIEQLEPLMKILNLNSGLNLTDEQGLFLLSVSGCKMPSLKPEQRISNFQNVWHYLEQCNQITKNHYHTMLQVLQYNRAPLKDYKIFLEEYEKLNGSPKKVLPHLLAVAGANGNVQQATEILAEMRSLQLALTEHDFNSLLLAHARANDINGVQTVVESMHATGITISTETQSTLVVAYMENGDETTASNIVEQYHGQFQSHEVLKMVQSVITCQAISQDFVLKLVKEFQTDYVKGPEVPISLRLICAELLHNKLKFVCNADEINL